MTGSLNLPPNPEEPLLLVFTLLLLLFMCIFFSSWKRRKGAKRWVLCGDHVGALQLWNDQWESSVLISYRTNTIVLEKSGSSGPWALFSHSATLHTFLRALKIPLRKVNWFWYLTVVQWNGMSGASNWCVFLPAGLPWYGLEMFEGKGLHVVSQVVKYGNV